MLSSILSVVLGCFSFIVPSPIILPVIGLGLGANGYIKENKKEDPQKTVKVIAGIGVTLCSLSVLIFFLDK